MTALQLYHDRTDWRASNHDSIPVAPRVSGNGVLHSGVSNPKAVGLILVPLIIGLGGTGSFLNAAVAALMRQGTTSRAIDRVEATSFAPVLATEEQTEAQRLGEELRLISGLTNEEIAPLIGVSRRSFQAWLAGASISARKEGRLRSVAHAIGLLAAEEPAQTRARLFGRDRYSVSPYDLLREGKFEAAIDLGLQKRKGLVRPRPAGQESLAEQFDRDQGSIPVQAVRLNRGLSKPIRR